MNVYRTSGTISTSGANQSGFQDGCSISIKIASQGMLLVHASHLSLLKDTSRIPDKATCQLVDSALSLLTPHKLWEESSLPSLSTSECSTMATKSDSQSPSPKENYKRLQSITETSLDPFQSILSLQVPQL